MAGIMATLGLSWVIAQVLPQMPLQIGQEPKQAAQWLVEQQKSFGPWGNLPGFLGLFDIRHAFWFTTLWAMFVASLSVGLLDTLWKLPGKAVLQPGSLQSVGRILFYVGALLAVAGAYWGDQHSWAARMSLSPGQSVDIEHGLSWQLRFEAFDTEPAPSGPGRDLQSRVSLLDTERTPIVEDVPLSAQRPFHYKGLSVRPVWFGRRVRLHVRDHAGRIVPLQTGADTSLTQEATLFFGRDDRLDVTLPTEGLRLVVDVRLGEQATALRVYRGDILVDEVRLIPSGDYSPAGLFVRVEQEPYITLQVDYFPGRVAIYRGAALAFAGLAILLLWYGHSAKTVEQW